MKMVSHLSIFYYIQQDVLFCFIYSSKFYKSFNLLIYLPTFCDILRKLHIYYIMFTVINWLNKQLNERQVSSRRAPPPPAPSNPPLHYNPHSLPSFDHNSFHPPAVSLILYFMNCYKQKTFIFLFK